MNVSRSTFPESTAFLRKNEGVLLTNDLLTGLPQDVSQASTWSIEPGQQAGGDYSLRFSRKGPPMDEVFAGRSDDVNAYLHARDQFERRLIGRQQEELAGANAALQKKLDQFASIINADCNNDKEVTRASLGVLDGTPTFNLRHLVPLNAVPLRMPESQMKALLDAKEKEEMLGPWDCPVCGASLLNQSYWDTHRSFHEDNGQRSPGRSPGEMRVIRDAKKGKGLTLKAKTMKAQVGLVTSDGRVVVSKKQAERLAREQRRRDIERDQTVVAAQATQLQEEERVAGLKMQIDIQQGKLTKGELQRMSISELHEQASASNSPSGSPPVSPAGPPGTGGSVVAAAKNAKRAKQAAAAAAAQEGGGAAGKSRKDANRPRALSPGGPNSKEPPKPHRPASHGGIRSRVHLKVDKQQQQQRRGGGGLLRGGSSTGSASTSVVSAVSAAAAAAWAASQPKERLSLEEQRVEARWFDRQQGHGQQRQAGLAGAGGGSSSTTTTLKEEVCLPDLQQALAVFAVDAAAAASAAGAGSRGQLQSRGGGSSSSVPPGGNAGSSRGGERCAGSVSTPSTAPGNAFAALERSVVGADAGVPGGVVDAFPDRPESLDGGGEGGGGYDSGLDCGPGPGLLGDSGISLPASGGAEEGSTAGCGSQVNAEEEEFRALMHTHNDDGGTQEEEEEEEGCGGASPSWKKGASHLRVQLPSKTEAVPAGGRAAWEGGRGEGSKPLRGMPERGGGGGGGGGGGQYASSANVNRHAQSMPALGFARTVQPSGGGTGPSDALRLNQAQYSAAVETQSLSRARAAQLSQAREAQQRSLAMQVAQQQFDIVSRRMVSLKQRRNTEVFSSMVPDRFVDRIRTTHMVGIAGPSPHRATHQTIREQQRTQSKLKAERSALMQSR